MGFDITRVLVSSAAVTGIALLWVKFNATVISSVCDIIINTCNAMKDPPVEPERYPAEEPGYAEEQEEQEEEEDDDEQEEEEDDDEQEEEEDDDEQG